MNNTPQTEDDERKSNNFNWLKLACRGPTYTSYFQFSHLPFCAFDWGEDGYAGRSNQGGELLYLSAPSQCEGLIMARGHFATSLYASLSRSQVEFGGPSTFGLEVSKCPYAYNSEGKVITEEDVQNESTSKKILGAKNGSSYRLGSMIDRGCFNYRWPVTEYYLDLHPDQRAVEHEEKERRKKMDEDAKKDEQNDTQDIPLDKHGIKGKEENVKKSAQCTSQAAQGAEDENGSNKKNTRFTSQGQPGTKEENRSEKKVTRFASQDEPSTKKKENDKKDQSPPKRVGTCQMFSCAKGDMFYQVLRIEEGGEFGMKFRHNSQIILTMGGPVWFQSFNDGEHDIVGGHGRTMMPRGDSVSVPTDKSQDPQEPVEKTEIVLDKSEHKPTGSIIRYWDPCGRGLEAKVYQLQDGEYKQLCMTKSPWEADNGPKYEEGSTDLTAYNAIGELQNLPIKSKGPRSVTFLAAIRLYEGDENGGDRNGFGRWPEDLELPTSEELFDHVGVDPDHDLRGISTGAMWESIFLDRRMGPEPVLELAEFNMIGRSLEKILQVDIIPVTIDDDDEKDEGDGTTYAALVSNLFVRENVDLKSLFWKIRFLIRTHKFLSHIRKLDQSSTRSKGEKQEPHLLKPDESSTQNKRAPVKSIEEFQMERIQTKVENVIRYLAKILLEESLANSRTRMMPERHVPGESNYYYVMITIWYVWKHFKEQFKDVPDWKRKFPDWKLEWTGRAQLANLKRNNPVLYAAKRLPSDNWAFAKADREKVALLQWYHYGSLLNLCRDGVLSESWLQSDLTSLERKVARLAKAAKMVSSAKLSSRESYVADDEIFDRLSFVSDELGLENLQSSNDIGIIESLAMTRVKQRDFTRSLNTGWLPKDEEESTSGPWEIHALCHHSRLVVLTKEEKSKQDWRTEEHTKAEAEIFRQKICVFLNAEGTLIPSWERAHAKARKAWLRSEATAVVASTLVIILKKKIRAESSGSSVLVGNASSEQFSTEEAMTEGSSISNVPAGNTSSKQTQTEQAGLASAPSEQSLVKISDAVKAHNDQIGRDQKKLLLEVLHLEGLMKGQLEAFERFTNESGLLPPIQWTSFRPGRKYHPLSFFNSLEDTPELYKAEEIGKATVPLSLCDLISSPEELKIQGKDFTKRDIATVLPKECLVLFDIKAAGKEEDDEGYTWEIERHKYDKAKKKESEDSFLWALYDSLVDQEVQHRFLTVIPEKDWDKKLNKNPDNNANKKSDRNVPKKPKKKSDKKSGKDSGKDSDNDSDKTAEKKLKNPYPIPREVLELLVYVIHPESAACLGDHVLNLSNFSCRPGDTWVASITLRSWRVESEPVKKNKKGERIETHDNLSDSSPEECHDFRLPLNLKQVWDQNKGVGEDTIFKPEVSSIILSTNSFGDFSKCTVVSGLFPDDKRDEEMESVVKDARKLWQKFIHQPQTARCLAFFLVLGKFCHEITDHYEKAISKLSLILKLDSTFTNTEDEYPPEFELGVWSLDALYKLQNSLNATVDSLQRAKDELTAQIIDGPGKRGVKLERMCQDYLGAFENNLVQLTAVSVKLNRRIELNTRNKDATSAVLTMRDSRTAISQNSTIQKLTYLTIGYLPMALMSAIFAIPPDLNVLFTPMSIHGRSWFVGAIFILSVATYVLAIFIGNVLDFFRYPPPRPGEVGKKPRSENPPNIWKWIYLPQFLHLLGQGFRAIGHWLLQIIAENTDPNWPDKKPEEPTPILTNDERSMEEGKAKVMTVETKSVSNGDETPNGALNP